ncbi:exodeoxyribonuclease VII large subunit [Bartonella rattimassiliensis]|uniref:exodeoxyribonuclease VII large subunit n=1 Tax=Bartonella rattimassiliensis TaxID=270250 RepID=UPI0018730890|nr:exodeoxyribonuclease VII large subunit [Bartonella rattimassiliensis]
MNLFGEKTNATNVAEFTVSEIAGALKRVVEEKFGYVRVRGEVSGYRGAHASGHAYFALKDDKARLEAVIWRGVMEKLKFPPEEGMEVIAVGKLTTYPGSSRYQIVIEALEPTGVGALMTLLENRKKQFIEEGLFDEEKKKSLPYMPQIIGVVTSPTGAVIRDIIHRISDRFPLHVLVWPVRVQGETSGKEVATAIKGFNALAPGGLIPKPDLIIVARGGGSLEDLWGFNDEAVVRAVYTSALPIISAVGHETDWTLIDYVADWRAPTPTGAAEKAVPVKLDLEVCVASLGARLRKGLARSFDFHQQKLRAARRGLPTVDQLFALSRRGFDEISSRLQRALCVSYDKKRFSFHTLRLRLSLRLLNSEKAQHNTREYTARLNRAFVRSVEKQRAQMEVAFRLLKSTSYQNILERGFVLALGQNNKPIKRLAQFPGTGQINLRFFDGDINVATQEPVSTKRLKHKQIKSPDDNQGTLF